MPNFTKSRRGRLRLSVAAALAVAIAAPASPAFAQPTVAPAEEVTLSVGTGRLVQLNGVMADLFVANEAVADVQVRSNTSVYVFGRAAGQTTVYATDRSGRVIYSASIRVGQNLASVDQMLDLAMPEANITATPMNGLVLLTGTVAAPSDVEEAQRLVQAFVGEGTQVVSRLRTATPQQVMLRVRIAEVSRNLIRELGVNLAALDPMSGFSFFRGQRTATVGPNGIRFGGFADGTSTIGAAAGIGGLDIGAALDANSNNGQVTILAEPNLTSLSGETASFLAGGEFPVPISQTLGQVTIEYKQYGVGLAFTPVVLEDGRISMRVRPEVSELATEGSIRLNGFDVPALTTRRAETTVELGSGQSFMIAGLLRNTSTNTIDRTPFLGNLPVLGALFRSTRFRRAETELVIIVTPYLVQPMNPTRVAMPTDGFRAADDAQRMIVGEMHDGRNNDPRPEPRVAAPGATPSVSSGPVIGDATPVPFPAAARPAPAGQRAQAAPTGQPTATASARPGFDF
ncbi:MAG TPA: type II and III secretion system protein family protein [Allosphingosinicella sp.]